MTVKLDLLDVDPQLAISEIEAGNYEEWNCPESILSLANKIESQVAKGGVCGGCYKPTNRRLTTATGEPPGDWCQMFVALSVDDVTFDLQESFGEPIQKLRDQIKELIGIADTLETLDSDSRESEAT